MTRSRLLVALLATLSACATPLPMNPAVAADPDLLTRIRTEIGDARCTTSAQCRALPIGAKACGGPRSYLPWSVVVSDAGRLKALSDELALEQRREQQRQGLMSDCRLVEEPAVACVEQRCVLQPGGGAATR